MQSLQVLAQPLARTEADTREIKKALTSFQALAELIKTGGTVYHLDTMLDVEAIRRDSRQLSRMVDIFLQRVQTAEVTLWKNGIPENIAKAYAIIQTVTDLIMTLHYILKGVKIAEQKAQLTTQVEQLARAQQSLLKVIGMISPG